MKWKFTFGRPWFLRRSEHSGREINPDGNLSGNCPLDGNGSHHAEDIRWAQLPNGFIRPVRQAATKLKSYARPVGDKLLGDLHNGVSRSAIFFKRTCPGLHARIHSSGARLRSWGHDSRVWFDSSFHHKILLPVIACTAAVLVLTFLVARNQMARQSDKEARQTLATADAALRYSQDLRRNDLLLRFHNLPNVPLWNQLFQSGAPRDLHNTLRSLMEMQKVDVVFYASPRGKILDSVNNPIVSSSEFEEAASPAVQLALRGDETVDTVRVGGKLYDVVTLPAYDSDGKKIGAVALGLELGDAAVQEFSKLTQSQVALLGNGRVIASTLPGLEANPQFLRAFENGMPGGDSQTPDIKPVVLNGVHYYSLSRRFASLTRDESLGYVLFSSREQSLVDKQAAQHILALASLLAIVCGALVVGFFVHRLTQPLRELRQKAEAVGHGDFSQRMPVTSRDECGQLALVFNQMTGNLEQSRAQLEQTVVTLKDTQDQLVHREKLSAIGEFVAGVAHELNNPLTVVVGFSEMLMEDAVDEKSRYHSDRIQKAAMRCRKIVQSLLNFARGDKPRREAVSMNAVIDAVLDLIGYSLRTGDIEIITALDPALPMVSGDASQLQQVLFNIISNAQQSIEASGRPTGRIRIGTETHGSHVRVIIEDNGNGILSENMSRLFDPFFTTKPAGKGTGLGLSLCYGFIKEHGGTITPISHFGKGAAFIIDLPTSVEPGVSPSSAETKKSCDGHGKRVLVIDDEEPILSLIREDLASQGYQVEVTTDGKRAVRELSEDRFDVAVCDWKMPGLNGRQIYERLRETNPEACRRVIFITGDVVNSQMRDFLESERRPCLSKPFTLPEFHDAVENILGTEKLS